MIPPKVPDTSTPEEVISTVTETQKRTLLVHTHTNSKYQWIYNNMHVYVPAFRPEFNNYEQQCILAISHIS